MRKASLVGLVALGALACGNLLFTGCGSEATEDPTADGGDEASTDGATGTDGSTQDSGARDAFIDAILDGGRDPDAATCKSANDTCTKSTECCTANCNPTSGKCEAPTSLCKLPGAACGTGNECCTFSCTGGKCADKLCVADNLACGTNGDCCGGLCSPDGNGGGTCTPLNGTGPASEGNPCTTPSQCASGFCQNGVCAPSSFCQQNGDACTTAAECCGGICTIAAGGTIGKCSTVTGGGGVGNCDVAGTVCSQSTPPAVCGGSCCSRSCAPYGPTGVNVCQPESGCKVTGDICMQDSDCCGAPGAPGSNKLKQDGTPSGTSANVVCSKAAGQTLGRCGNPGSCRPAGDTCKLATVSCNAPDDCCAGIVQTHPLNCQQDALGIPRCVVVRDFDCAAGTPPPGTPCASSADCCGAACVPNPAGGQPAFICGAACIPSGGTCSSTADCCAGLPCAVAPGQTKGICGGAVLPDGGVNPDGGGPVTTDGGTAGDGGVCALYGQMCTQGSDCCSNVPCTNGTCHYP